MGSFKYILSLATSINFTALELEIIFQFIFLISGYAYIFVIV